MTKERKQLGASGEKLAADFLRKKGYEIIAVNWRCRLGEIDVIARDGRFLAFCEVKTRSGTAFGSPLEAITAEKQTRLRRLGEFYWSFSTDRTLTVRFDAISIIRGAIDHIEGAF